MANRILIKYRNIKLFFKRINYLDQKYNLSGFNQNFSPQRDNIKSNLADMVMPSLMFESNFEKFNTNFELKKSSDKTKNVQQSMNYSGKKLQFENLMDHIQAEQIGINKVTVVGSGYVGIACVACMLQQRITNNICLMDPNRDKTYGEVADLNHGSSFFSKLHITPATDFEATADSKVCVITAGVRRKPNQSRSELTNQNVEVIKEIVKPIVKYSPKAVYIITTTPVDIVSNVFWKLSGLPKGRVIGTGCELDSSRFRYFISEKLGLAPSSCHGWIIGEHGDHSVPVWSSVNVAGVRFMGLNPIIGKPGDPENWGDVHKKVINCATDILNLKGYTSWAIAMTCAALTNAVLYNLGTVHSVCFRAKGYHEIKEDIFLSLPATLGINGVNRVIKQTLTKHEAEALRQSAKAIDKKQASIKV